VRLYDQTDNPDKLLQRGADRENHLSRHQLFSGEKDLGKTLEQLAVRRAMSEAIPAASGSK
jgi:hypothetical protein